MLETNKIYLGDCFDVMKDIDDKSIDMVLCDLPYGITKCKWDKTLDLGLLWIEYKRIIKDNGNIVLTGSQPFTTDLINANRKWFKYEIIWEKNLGSGFLYSKRKPLKFHENILIFNNLSNANQFNKISYKFNPQGLIKIESKTKIGNRKHDSVYTARSYHCEYKTSFTNYPRSIIKFNVERGIHPTQKPVALFEYLIKTYTNPGELVLDNCIGSGTTALACINTGRNYIGIEKDEEYFKVAEKRIAENNKQIKIDI